MDVVQHTKQSKKVRLSIRAKELARDLLLERIIGDVHPTRALQDASIAVGFTDPYSEHTVGSGFDTRDIEEQAELWGLSI